MSITKAGNEGKNQAISSCEYLEERFWECSKKEGVVFATNVETLGGGLEKEKQRSWERRRRRKESSAMRDVRLSGKINRVCQKNYMMIGVRKLLRTGLVPATAWRGQAVGIAPTERLKLRRQMAAAAAGKKESVSLSLSSWR